VSTAAIFAGAGPDGTSTAVVFLGPPCSGPGEVASANKTKIGLHVSATFGPRGTPLAQSGSLGRVTYFLNTERGWDRTRGKTYIQK